MRSCNCCPYGYHIDLDFVRYCESLANAKPSEEELQRRSRRRSRKSMEFMLGLDSIFDQWDAIDKQQTLTEVSRPSIEFFLFDVLRFLRLTEALDIVRYCVVTVFWSGYQSPGVCVY